MGALGQPAQCILVHAACFVPICRVARNALSPESTVPSVEKRCIGRGVSAKPSIYLASDRLEWKLGGMRSFCSLQPRIGAVGFSCASFRRADGQFLLLSLLKSNSRRFPPRPVPLSPLRLALRRPRFHFSIRVALCSSAPRLAPTAGRRELVKSSRSTDVQRLPSSHSTDSDRLGICRVT